MRPEFKINTIFELQFIVKGQFNQKIKIAVIIYSPSYRYRSVNEDNFLSLFKVQYTKIKGAFTWHHFQLKMETFV